MKTNQYIALRKLSPAQMTLVKEILESVQLQIVQKINSREIVNDQADAAIRAREYQINKILELLS